MFKNYILLIFSHIFNLFSLIASLVTVSFATIFIANLCNDEG